MIAAGREAGLATVETVLMITVLVPLLFAIVQFGGAFQRLLAQDAATAVAARHAAEVGGDLPEVRALLIETLRLGGIDAVAASVDITPSRVSWREPIRVTVTSQARLAIPFALTASVPLRSTAVARGEVNQ